MIPPSVEKEKLVLFDGICNLCDNAVLFIIKNDKNNTFKFAPLQGKHAKPIIDTFKIDKEKTDSILLFTPQNKLFTKSTAALKIAYELRFPINLMVVFLIVPKFIRDFVYDYIAKNRYRWFGKKDNCMIPTKALKSKFLE